MVITVKGNLKLSKRLKYKINFDLTVDNGDFLDCENVAVKNGTLFSACAFRELYRNFKSFTLAASSGKTLYYHTDMTLCRFRNTSETILNERQPITGSSSVTYRGKTLISLFGLGTYALTDISCHKLTNFAFDSFAVAGERVFGLKNNKVYFSETGECVLTEKSDYVELPTVCRSLAFAGETMYVLGATCYTLTADADSVKFKIKKACQAPDNINAYSVKAVGTDVLFAADTGIYRLRQNRVVKILDGLEKFLDMEWVCAETYENRYVLCCPAQDFVTPRMRKALVLDTDKGKVTEIFCDGAYSFTVYNENLTVSTETNALLTLSPFIDNSSEIKWKKSEITLGSGGKKFLRAVTVQTDNPIELYVSNGKETRLLRVEGKKSVQTLPVSGAGERFTVTLKARGRTRVSLLEFTADAYLGEAKNG